MTEQDEEGESKRQKDRRQKRELGNRAAKAARTLMELRPRDLERLRLSEDVDTATQRARGIKSAAARRREERRLAGVLRNADLADIEGQLHEQAQSGRANARMFQLAEGWRERLLDEGQPALEELHAEVPGLEMEAWQELVANARNERDRGAPKGARKLLFRRLMTALRVDAELPPA